VSAQARAAARSRLHPAGHAQADDGRVLAPFGRRRCEVMGNRESGGYRVFAALDAEGPLPRAGQFYMLATVAGWSGEDARPYLPRAFSVARAAAAEDGVQLEFLVEGVGPGSERLAALDAGEELWVTGPLGRPFPAPHEIDPGLSGAILVGGGIGVAPLAILRGEMARAGIPSRTLLGFRDRAHAGGIDLFDCSEIRLASEDGHVGHRGFVTDLLAVLLEGDAASSAAVYACGPPAMLEAVRVMCAERGMAAELALETPMACGYGACFGCAVPLVDGGYLRLCVDGPVVPAPRIASAMVEGSGHR
jgi:dihydroorotate dehydrogenase electron transfer subunit